MSLTLEIPGGLVQLSGNRVQAKVTTSAITGTGYNLLLKTTSLDDSFPEGIDAIEPDATTLNALFDIRNRATVPLTYDFTWPLTGAVSANYAQLAKKVAVDVGEIYTDAQGVQQKNWAGLVGVELIILRGGISKHQQAKYNEQETTFYTEYIEAGKFLTLLPDNQKISEAQPVKLWFLPIAADDVTLKVTYELEDGSSGTSTHSVSLLDGNICELLVDPSSLGLNPALTKSYTIQLIDDLELAVSESRTYQIDHNHYERNIYLFAVNRLGGIDCYWFAGHFTRSHNTEGQISERDARITDTQKRATIDVDYKEGRRVWSVNCGYRETEEEMEALVPLLESRNVWKTEGNDIIPVRLNDGDNDLYNTIDDVHNVELTIYEAH